MRGRKLWATVALLFVCSNIRARASATLLLEEPFRHDGNFAGTGHVAIYLDRVCADSPVVLRPCGPGEQGVVLSRYHGIAGYDWLAIPLIPYLYAVDSPEKVPLYADDKLEAFLRERYRQKYLRAVAPDANHGEPPDGPWVQLVGAAYDRTIYGFRIETSRVKDKELIRILNSRPNTSAYKLLSNNCADFVRRIVNFYYPRSLTPQRNRRPGRYHSETDSEMSGPIQQAPSADAIGQLRRSAGARYDQAQQAREGCDRVCLQGEEVHGTAADLASCSRRRLRCCVLRGRTI